MKRLLLMSLLGAVGLLALVAGLALTAFDAQPALQRSAELTPQHVERALRILARHDPRKIRGGALRTVDIAAADADLAANYLASHYAGGSARAEFAPRRLTLVASLPLSQAPFPLASLRRFANVRAVFREAGAVPELDSLTLGRLPVPAWAAESLVERMLTGLNRDEQLRLAAAMLREVKFTDRGLQLRYEWRADLPDQLRRVVLTQDELARIRAYHDRLAALVADRSLPRTVALPRLLVPLVQLAAERTSQGGAATQDENRALIAVLALYLTGQHPAAVAADAAGWPRAVGRAVTLGGRNDLAQHFAVSAALAAYAGSPLADAIGLYKELKDARGGSGFSFNDLAADRAGTVFGELAIRADAAAALQRLVGAGIDERDIMPDVADLPEFMPAAEFERRFGGIDGAGYRAMMRDIERRVGACGLYRRLGGT